MIFGGGVGDEIPDSELVTWCCCVPWLPSEPPALMLHRVVAITAFAPFTGTEHVDAIVVRASPSHFHSECIVPRAGSCCNCLSVTSLGHICCAFV